MTKLPLEGFRVLDLSWVWAGPYTALQMGHLGAEVIKVESTLRPDINRRIPPFAEGRPGLDRGGSFNQWNQNKRSLALDLSNPKAKAIVLELVKKCDVAIENFSAGVLDKMGLGYKQLSAQNPRLVMVSLSGFGQTGPISRNVAYGATVMAMGGLTALTGYRNQEPRSAGLSYPDPNSALHAVFAILASLWRRDRTGQGEYIDCSLLETMVAVMPEGLMTEMMRGEQPARDGNRDPVMAPYGVYRCAGEDNWISICVRDENEWRDLCAAMKQPELAIDPRFATAAARKHNEDELDDILTSFTGRFDFFELEGILQRAGVAAAAVMSAKDVAADQHLEARGFFVRLNHPETGVFTHAGTPWHFSATPVPVRRPAPQLGEATEYVVKELLGYSDAEYQKLLAEGVFK
ncbi:MAG TPA: CoA transferase [Candidatus Binataceae bacterium]|nr:CoA transferase [Candidatus Binataceae bacterium]